MRDRRQEHRRVLQARLRPHLPASEEVIMPGMRDRRADFPPARGEPCRTTLVVGLDSGRVVGVGLPACRTSPPCPHQAGGDLIVVVPKVPHLSCGSTEAVDVPLRVSPSLGFTACVTYVCNGAPTPKASSPGLLLGGPGLTSCGWGQGRLAMDERRRGKVSDAAHHLLPHGAESSTRGEGRT